MKDRIHRVIYLFRTFRWLLFLPAWRLVPKYPIRRPIFLLGTQGGGLTLLSRMIRRHPKVISVGGNSSYWSSADEMQNVFGLILPFELTGLRYKAPPHPYLTAPRSWTYAARDLYLLYRKYAANATEDLRDVMVRLIRFSALLYARDKEDFRFLDKSQTMCVRVGLIYKLLQESNPCFVLVPRDPYVSVYRAATGKAGDMRRLAEVLSLPERIDICAEHYSNSMRAVFEDCDALAIDFFLLRFEDLIENTEQSLRNLCRFLELEFLPMMLPREYDRLPLGSRYLDRWYPIRNDVNERYREEIDDSVISRVNHYCGDLIPRLGYSKRGLTG